MTALSPCLAATASSRRCLASLLEAAKPGPWKDVTAAAEAVPSRACRLLRSVPAGVCLTDKSAGVLRPALFLQMIYANRSNKDTSNPLEVTNLLHLAWRMPG